MFETFRKWKGMSLALMHLERMPKLYVPQGLSSRVHTALIRRMANADAEINDQPAPSEINENDNKESSDDEKEKEPESHEKEKEPMSRERSRSPRGDGTTDEQAGGGVEEDVLREVRKISDFDPRSPVEVLAACNGLAIGLTTLVAAIKGNTDHMNLVINQGQAVQEDVRKSMLTLAQSTQNMANAAESLSAGVGYSTSRVGALVGETQKVRKHLEWFASKSLVDLRKESVRQGDQKDEKMATAMENLALQMKEMQEGLVSELKAFCKAIEDKTIEKELPMPETTGFVAPTVMPPVHSGGVHTGGTASTSMPSLGPPLPPSGMGASLPGSPITPMTPKVPPPPAPVPPAIFAGYSPASQGQAPMQFALDLGIPDRKAMPVIVKEEATGMLRSVSPTAYRNHPSTGTAAYAPLGWMSIKGSNEYRRVFSYSAN